MVLNNVMMYHQLFIKFIFSLSMFQTCDFFSASVVHLLELFLLLGYLIPSLLLGLILNITSSWTNSLMALSRVKMKSM